MRAINILADEKLIELDTMGKSIKVPEPFGTFEGDKHYLETLDLLLAATRETENRNDFFIKNVIPKVTKDAMIDVGVGDGKLTELVGQHFQSVTVVDPSEHAANVVGKYLYYKNIRKIISSIVNADLPANQFDLAMLSHTLYYIDTKLWVEVTQKMLDSLKKGGLLVIVLNGGLDKDMIATIFGGKRLEIEKYIDDCRNNLNAQSISISHTTEYFKTKSLLSMLHIVGLHLYDVNAVATTQALTDYLTARKDQLSQLYQFKVRQHFILIRK